MNLFIYEGTDSVIDILTSVILISVNAYSPHYPGTIQTLTMTMAALITTTINTMATLITTTTTTTCGSNLSKEISSCVHLQISKEISSPQMHLQTFPALVQHMRHLLHSASFSAFSTCLSNII